MQKEGLMKFIILRFGESIINFIAWVSIIAVVLISFNADNGLLAILFATIGIILEVLFFYLIFAIIDIRNSLKQIVYLLSENKNNSNMVNEEEQTEEIEE